MKIENNEYKIVETNINNLNESLIIDKYSTYYDDYQYLVGDFADNKLRLKGFYEEDNEKCQDYNNFKNVKNYLKRECSCGCQYFILKKIK